ncbi:MAG: rhomboid family intramembrane serine protease [Sneathiella sp.]|nr:rhomboid family intramembrane serine protease [Sneathiella sp.]
MKYLGKKFKPVLILLALIWVVEIVNILTGHSLSNWGILPRTMSGLMGIPLSPFIHGSLWHAISNTVPLLVLGSLLLTSGHKRFWMTTIGIVLFSGLLVWLFARGSYHIGASGLVFGYFGALITRAVIMRSFPSMIIALVTVLLYGGILWGLIPLRSYVSFEGHFFGLLAGIIYTWMTTRKPFEKSN